MSKKRTLRIIFLLSEVAHIISKLKVILFIKTEQIIRAPVPSSVKWNELKRKIEHKDSEVPQE